MARSSVLVVDDEESMRYFLERSLKRRGFRVRAVSTGEAAVDEVRRSAPDIVLLDLMLPGLSGIDVLKETRRTAPGAAVILMTGFGSVERALEAMRHGAADFITKPFKIEDLEAKIGEALKKVSPGSVPSVPSAPSAPARRTTGESAPRPVTAFLLQAARARGISTGESESGDLPLREAGRIFEALYLNELIERTGGNVSLAARIAGISRPSLHRKIQELGIDVSRYRV